MDDKYHEGTFGGDCVGVVSLPVGGMFEEESALTSKIDQKENDVQASFENTKTCIFTPSLSLSLSLYR